VTRRAAVAATAAVHRGKIIAAAAREDRLLGRRRRGRSLRRLHARPLTRATGRSA
jgi:hypothetical protein